MTAPAQQTTTDPQQAEQVDLSPVRKAFETALAALLAHWAAVKAAWIADLVRQVGAAIAAGDVARFGQLTVDSTHAAGIVHDALTALASTAAARVVAEAEAQGVDGVKAVQPSSGDLAAQATVAADLLGAALATSAGAEAVRVHHPGAQAAGTEDAVRSHLESLSDAQVVYVLGAALHGAQNAARTATFAAGGRDVQLYASEVLDDHVCPPCAEIHGRVLKEAGSDDWSQVYAAYPVRGYVGCLGRDRCRGTVVGLWIKGDR